MSIKKLLTLADVQGIIGGENPPAITTLERWARQGKLPVIRLSGKCIRVDRDALQQFITASSGNNCRKGSAT